MFPIKRIVIDLGQQKEELSSEAFTGLQRTMREWAFKHNIEASQTARCTAGTATFYYGEDAEQRLMDDVDKSFDGPKLVV